MRIYIDSADSAVIATALATGWVYGVTTNPTLLRRADRSPAAVPALVAAAVAQGAREVHVQIDGEDISQQLRQGRELHKIDAEHVVVKIPATATGYTAAARLAGEGIPVTLTAVYTVRQAILAQSAGASYVAVYLGRARDAGLDSLTLIGQMQRTLDAQHAKISILAASIRDPFEIEALAELGVATATLPPGVLHRLLDSPETAAAAAAFLADAEAIH